MRNHSKNFIKLIFLFTLLSIKTVFAGNKPEIKTQADFQNWVEAKILCQEPRFQNSEANQSFSVLMKKLNFIPEIDIDEESGLFSGQVIITSPIFVHGFILKEISFYMDSGRGFTATLEATPDELAILVKNKKLDQFSIKRTSRNMEYGLYIFPTKKPEFYDGHESLDTAILVNSTKQKNLSTITCQQFDG